MKEFVDLNNLVKIAKKKNVSRERGVDGYFQQKRQLENIEVEETCESKVIRSDIATTENSLSCFRQPFSFSM